MFVIYFITLVCAVGGSWKCFHKLANPILFYGVIWGSIVALYQLRLSAWQAPLSDATYVVLLVALGAFALPCLAAGALANRGSAGRIGSLKLPGFRFTLALFLVWLGIEAFEVVAAGGIPVIWHLTGDVRTYFDFGVPTLHGLMNALGLSIILCLAESALNDSGHRWPSVAIICVMLLFYLCILTRQVLISAAIEIAVLVMLERPSLFRKAIVPALFIGIIVFGLLGNVRTGYEGFLAVAMLSSALPPLLIGFDWVYMYLTMTLANVNSLVMMGADPIGLPLLASYLPSALKAVLGVSAVTGASFIVSPNFTVSGYFAEAYLGFGILGVAVISALYGAFSGIAFSKAGRGAPIWRMLYAVMLEMVLLSFFDDMLLYFPNSFQLILIPLIALIATNLNCCRSVQGK